MNQMVVDIVFRTKGGFFRVEIRHILSTQVSFCFFATVLVTSVASIKTCCEIL